ncbi:MBL fold metallo-hydrolase [Candidatus Marinimicrobia bacterium MT.SAG.4]|nr:MBL fold metallo-hydrolase [Candidatus Marinimicrobia bacterium MT.SAG.4]
MLLISNIIMWREAVRFRGSEVIFINVGQGDAAFIDGYNSKNILIDSGRSDFGVKSGKYSITPYLHSIGISRINYLLLTHADSDHIGGAEYLINNFKVDTLLFGVSIPNSNLFSEIVNIAKNMNIPFKKIILGDLIKLGNYSEIQVLYPPRNYITPVNKTENNSSVVIKYRFANSTILFTADIEALTEKRISDSDLNMKSNLLKVPHHGSRSSSSELFLEKVSPLDAIISAGENNPYGHPSREVLDRYEVNGIRVHRTDKDNALIFRSKGGNYSLYKWK